MHRRVLTLSERSRRRAVPQLLRSAGAAVLSIALIGLASPAVAATQEPTSTPTSQASPEPSSSSTTVTATVGAANDGVLLPGQDLQLSVSVRNGTTESIDGARVEVTLDSRTLDSRDELDAWLDGETDDEGSPTGEGADLRLLPSGSAQVTLTIPAAAIPFSADPAALGSHAVAVTVTSPGGTLATARNSVELTNGAPSERETGVSVLVPLTVPDSSDGLIPAETLQDYTQSTGTLSRQLDSVVGRAVTIGVDPRILASIRILGDAAPESARTWLDRLESAPNEVFALPYADADVAAQAQSGLSTLLTPTSFEYGIDDSLFADPPSTATPTPTATADAPQQDEDLPTRPTTESLTSFDWSPTIGSLAWPDDLTVRGADLGIYATSGMNRTVVSSANLSLPSSVSTLSTASIDGNDVVVADSTLSTALDDAVSSTSDSEWRARMTSITAGLAQVQRDGESPDVVLALDRGSAIDGARLAQTLDAIDGLPWAEGTSLAVALTDPVTEGVTVVDAPETEERLADVSDLLTVAARIESFSAVLSEPELLSGKRRNDLLALLAVTWRGDPAGWSDAVTASEELAATTLTSVTIEAADSVTQVSRDSSIPVYVRNDLPWPVSVRIQASTSNAVLDIDEASVEPTMIDARSQGRVLIPVKARVGNGETSLRMQLTALDGTAIGTPTSVVTSVRADWETVGTLLLGIVLVVVFGAGILRNIRRRRRGDPIEEEEDPNAPLAVQPGFDDERTDPRG
ncbi:hypothetical protein GSU68_18265 [Rathayibacter sp. VKM Ac-2759]|uniref:DUF6049 family protein n=1 Tax=Rathayibacter sp. VKM Ac-2759 TaxID=2609252 RepID=UPI0013182571|nr:DUF6049 family protein [Rathayibacter sp. VKM Ac-2759]QHC68319.1 hypothetical protein GSU68_18265 [Rathayibacter sp. VKM Ac-2759]